jgi:competence protein ComEC
MVLSHAHPDHVKGLIYIAKNFTLGEFWESGIHPGPDESFKELKGVLAERHIPVRFINASTRPIIIGEARVEPISPRSGNLPSEDGTDMDENESSLVFRLKYSDFSMLFTGDIGFFSERRLLGHPGLLASTILKTPHHGSRYSSSDAFVHAVSPCVALIGAGYGNSFGLPSGRTLALLNKCGIRVFRTDLDGTVEVVKNKGGYHISTFDENGHFH